MLTRRTEENLAQMTGLNLEIYLEIGLALEIYPDRRQTNKLEKRKIHVKYWKTEEIPAQVSNTGEKSY